MRKNRMFVLDSAVSQRAPSLAMLSGSVTSFGLTPDLLEKARLRLKGAALVIGCGILVMPLIFFLWWSTKKISLSLFVIFQIEASLALLASVLLYFLAKNKKVSHHAVLSAGILYEIFICLIASTSVPAMHYLKHGHITTPVLTYVIALVFAVLIPLPLKRSLGVVLLVTCNVFLCLLLLKLAGVIQVSGSRFLNTAGSVAPLVVMVLFSAYVIYGMNHDLAEARRMGSYRLEKLLARGGMGEIWQASHQMLARPAAVKLIRQEVLLHQDPEKQESTLTLFEHEAQVTANLHSPHTIELYDYGIADDGTLFYVMELLDGFDLKTLVGHFGHLSTARTIHLMTQACHSLAEAHRHGLVHRDIKPGNMIVCRERGGEVDFLKVLDFGLVGIYSNQENNGEDAPRLCGSPGYIAPEVCRGEKGDQRADIYALGCVAYLLLTGNPAFAPTRDLVKHIQEVLHHTPPPPSLCLSQPLPKQLEQVILSCLAKDPADRPQSAEELAQALQTSPLPKPWTDDDARNWWKEATAESNPTNNNEPSLASLPTAITS